MNKICTSVSEKTHPLMCSYNVACTILTKSHKSCNIGQTKMAAQYDQLLTNVQILA